MGSMPRTSSQAGEDIIFYCYTGAIGWTKPWPLPNGPGLRGPHEASRMVLSYPRRNRLQGAKCPGRDHDRGKRPAARTIRLPQFFQAPDVAIQSGRSRTMGMIMKGMPML